MTPEYIRMVAKYQPTDQKQCMNIYEKYFGQEEDEDDNENAKNTAKQQSE